MAVGLGAVYPQFHNPNAAKIASSFGAVIYMILGMFVVLTVLVFSFRFTMYLGHGYDEGFDSGVSLPYLLAFVASFFVPFLAGLGSIKLGARSLRKRQ
jgi:hypothetical protein